MLYEAGWAGLSWPVEAGGRGASIAEQAAFAEEMARAHLPRQLNLVGLELVGPMIIRFGDSEQRRRHLGPLLRGDEIWCQLFSEPGAGSDLAAISTRASIDGSGWRVSGQKIWTSGAQYSDFGLLLARTERDSQRHRGLSCFLVPMRQPGIDIRPILQMDGEQKFNEVFLDDVKVTADEVLGPVGEGWAVAMSTLGRERLTLGAQAIAFQEALEEIRSLALARGIRTDPEFRERWVKAWTRVHALRITWGRAIGADASGADPRMSTLKLTASELLRDITNLAGDVLGMAMAGGDEAIEWRQRWLAAPGQTLAGGTSEIQRNIIAERVLGLPRG